MICLFARCIILTAQIHLKAFARKHKRQSTETLQLKGNEGRNPERQMNWHKSLPQTQECCEWAVKHILGGCQAKCKQSCMLLWRPPGSEGCASQVQLACRVRQNGGKCNRMGKGEERVGQWVGLPAKGVEPAFRPEPSSHPWLGWP